MGTTTAGFTGSAVEIELEIRDRDCLFVDASAVAECRIELEHMVNRSDGQLLEYFTVSGVAPARVKSVAEDSPAISDVRLINRGVDGGLFEFVVSGPCVTTTLADTGAIARSVSAENGVGEIVADVPAHVDVRPVVERFQDRHPDSTLTACRRSNDPVPLRSMGGVHSAMADDLTDKQLEVLRTAYLSGYFSWPRRTSAEDCADALDIAQPTFSQHIRAAQEKLLHGLFEGQTDQ